MALCALLPMAACTGGGILSRPSSLSALTTGLAARRSSQGTDGSVGPNFRRRGHSSGACMVAWGKKEPPKKPLSIVSLERASSCVTRCIACLDRCSVKIADSVIGGVGLGLSMAGLSVLERKLGVKLFAPPMMASGIIFFAREAPPDPRGFFSGTLGSGVLCAGIFSALTNRGCTAPVASGAAAGALLVWFKATNTIFPPAAVLSGLVAQSIVTHTSKTSGFAFLAFPWLAGHGLLYASAMAVGQARQAVHGALSARHLRVLPSVLKSQSLREVFNTFDTSKDGHLDAMELKLALQTATGIDMSLKSVNAIIRSIDANGDGVIWSVSPLGSTVLMSVCGSPIYFEIPQDLWQA